MLFSFYANVIFCYFFIILVNVSLPIIKGFLHIIMRKHLYPYNCRALITHQYQQKSFKFISDIIYPFSMFIYCDLKASFGNLSLKEMIVNSFLKIFTLKIIIKIFKTVSHYWSQKKHLSVVWNMKNKILVSLARRRHCVMIFPICILNYLFIELQYRSVGGLILGCKVTSNCCVVGLIPAHFQCKLAVHYNPYIRSLLK